ncbi:MAG: Phosphoenolpyruvate synthase/pyruvate phosphate dikinase [Candidatus Alkanophagales archaeon MCA70_species_1]|nr:Phosphoenolpyruvate synthase/pyruvate phosphate dikinase [Candidatus Alkanophaga volatiphilum]
MGYVVWFEELRKEDVSLVGGKAANLGELTSRTDVPVPPGFAITAEAYKYFINYNKLGEKIEDLLKDLDVDDTEKLNNVSSEIRALIESGEFPPDLRDEIIRNYRILGEKVGMENPYVAVRSSATAEDLPGASFAGQQDTFLDVRGEENLLTAVKRAFSSLFTPRAIFYREEKGFEHLKVYLSCVVQKMVNAKAAGVMFTIDPVTGNPDVVVIEGAWGLGEFVVQGTVTPDRFVVRKSDLSVVEKQVGRKEKKLVRGDGGPVEVEVEPELIEKPCLSDEQIRTLADYAIRIEKHYGTPQDIEWALDADTDELYILQARPETVWSVKDAAEKRAEAAACGEAGEAEIILRGLPASPGIAYGKAHVIEDVSKLGEFKEGEILVTKMTAPDWVPAMRKARAIITDDGGMTCHAAIVSRELGIPAIVGSKEATRVLRTGMDITVDATKGVVYKGVVKGIKAERVAAEAAAAEAAAPAAATSFQALVTGTKILCNLGVPEKAEEVARLPVDGVGLMRVEFIIASHVGVHPLKLIEEGREQEYIDALADGIARVASAFYPRPVVMRFSDFKTNEYRELRGGEKYEGEEANPMLGWRGAARYIDKRFEPAFRLELKALKKVRDEMGLKNVWVMVPFCRTVEEIRRIVDIMKEEGLERGKDFKVWLMCEIPSNVILVDKFSEFVDGFSIGSNDLTQLILGVDRDSEILAPLFDERDEAVKRAIAYFIKKAHEYGKTVSICGQAPSVYPEFCEFLVRCGIDSISVNPDAIVSTRFNVAQIEKKIQLERALKDLK